jgi:PII-like signaling protein
MHVALSAKVRTHQYLAIDQLTGELMLRTGPAMKVTIHLNQDTGAAKGFLLDEIFAFLRRSGVEGATAFRAYAGFGAHHQLHTSGAGDVAGLHLPVILYFIEGREKVESVLPELLALITDGLVEAHPTNILKNASDAGKVIS